MKKIIPIASIITLLIVIAVGAVYITSDRTPSIVGYYVEKTNRIDNSEDFTIQLNSEKKYSITYEGKSYKGSYEASKDHSYILENNDNLFGYVILTEKKTYVLLPDIRSKPFLVSRQSGVLDDNGNVN